MEYLSTRNKTLRLTGARAIAQGLSRDGGLLTPASFPHLGTPELEALCGMDYPRRAARIMKLFLDEFTPEELEAFARDAYGPDRFEGGRAAPLRRLDDRTWCLELWHGPTSAFKDLALQMLPRLLSASLKKLGERRTACILTATSGDTGKAAMEGFADVPQTKILVFYPVDGVSQIQKLQMVTQEGANVGVSAVRGNFDDAQNGVKAIFSDEALRGEMDAQGFFFSSANSINWGRILPQMAYYVSAYCDLVNAGALKPGEKMNVCVPTGNFGNILACYYVGKMGVPVGKLLCASNANNVLTDFLRTGVYDRNRPFYTTASPSMDILISSNLERLLFDLSGGDDALVERCMGELAARGRYEVPGELKEKLGGLFYGGFCGEKETLETIGALWRRYGYLMDPHTAVAAKVLGDYRKETGDGTPAVFASTASPFKFCVNVLKALGETPAEDSLDRLEQLHKVSGVAIPARLAALRGRAVRFTGVTEKENMAETVRAFLS